MILKTHLSTFLATALLSSTFVMSGCGTDDTDSKKTAPTSTTTDTDNSTNTGTLLSGTTLSGAITSDTLLDATKAYKIDGLVTVKNGATLTIPAGTTLYGGQDGYLVVAMGAKIMAKGTSTSPIIFTSEAAYNGDTEARGQWGGVTLLGKSTTNEANLKYEVDESNTDFAFGSKDAGVVTDSSGELSYVKILNSGLSKADNKEINGLSLCGVGSGTVIDNITVERSGDDGVEIWGGTVNLTNITIKDAGDDSFDIDNGYVGNVTGLTITQVTQGASGIEMTNSGDLPRTKATFKDVTIKTIADSKDGAIYFKDDGVASTFENVSIEHNSATNGAIYARKILVADALANISFTNMTFAGSNSIQVSGATDSSNTATVTALSTKLSN
jgi:hypothetical protein